MFPSVRPNGVLAVFGPRKVAPPRRERCTRVCEIVHGDTRGPRMLESPPAVKPPVPFGAFELLKVVGRGANATVYKARHVPTGRIAAIKILPRLLGMDPAAIERFRREFTVIRQLTHRHLVRSLAHGIENGLHYVVVEYVPGLNLEQLLKKRGALSIEHTAVIFVQVADALRHLHTRHILHRDIKPSNIFLN